MKTKLIILAALIIMSAGNLFAGEKTGKFEVKGNCSMCEKRIEGAATDVAGVSTADWDKKSKILEVVFDDSKTDVNKIQMAIAAAGHDTPIHKATEEVYKKLPKCCQYNRQDKTEHKGDQH